MQMLGPKNLFPVLLLSAFLGGFLSNQLFANNLASAGQSDDIRTNIVGRAFTLLDKSGNVVGGFFSDDDKDQPYLMLKKGQSTLTLTVNESGGMVKIGDNLLLLTADNEPQIIMGDEANKPRIHLYVQNNVARVSLNSTAQKSEVKRRIALTAGSGLVSLECHDNDDNKIPSGMFGISKRGETMLSISKGIENGITASATGMIIMRNGDVVWNAP